MASNAQINIKYLARLHETGLDRLAVLYNWEHLSIANEDGYLWIKGLTEDEIESVELMSIPGIERFYSKSGKLYPFQKLLPIGNEPSCLWTAIKRAIHLDLPSKNHNFFELAASLQVNVIPSDQTKEVSFHMVDLPTFGEYVKTASTLRLHPLLWVIVENKALIIGTPILPLPGKTYWKLGNFIIPSGYDFEIPALSDAINQKLNPDNRYDLLWNENQTYTRISKTTYTKLTRSSVAQTLQWINTQKGAH